MRRDGVTNAAARRGPSPVVLILGATVISGATGYLVTFLVAANVGAAQYATFAVFWSALYFVIGATGGVQQEISRATSAGTAPGPRDAARLARFGIVLAASMLIVLAGTSPFWSGALFGTGGAGGSGLALALAVGVAGYALVAVLVGAFYGSSAWYPIAVMIALDGVVRLVGVSAALAADADVTVLGWAVVVPFPIAIAVVFPLTASRLRRSVTLDVAPGRLAWNSARTAVAAAATAALISGFPAMLSATSGGSNAAELAPVILALTLTRAPVVIPLLSLQSYLIVDFGTRASGLLRRVLLIEAVLAATALALAAVAAAAGPWVVVAIFGAEYDLDGWMFGVIVASSALVAGMCVTGPALISRSLHSANVLGWGAAAVVTLVCLVLPLDLNGRVAVALVVGPVVGLITHGFALGAALRPTPA
jgi:hypothetical protein